MAHIALIKVVNWSRPASVGLCAAPAIAYMLDSVVQQGDAKRRETVTVQQQLPGKQEPSRLEWRQRFDQVWETVDATRRSSVRVCEAPVSKPQVVVVLQTLAGVEVATVTQQDLSGQSLRTVLEDRLDPRRIALITAWWGIDVDERQGLTGDVVNFRQHVNQSPNDVVFEVKNGRGQTVRSFTRCQLATSPQAAMLRGLGKVGKKITD